MKNALMFCAMLVFAGGLSQAATWSGTLLDANCYHRHGTARACNARPGTTSFMIESHGTRYRLDGASNERAREDMRARADRAFSPKATKAVPVKASITGTLKRDHKIHAETISLAG